MSAAYHLAKEFQIDVTVLEAGEFGWGSSGRNGGFCCIGGTMMGPKTLATKFGLEETRKFYAVQRDAVELVDGVTHDEGIDVDRSGDCEITNQTRQI